MPGASGRLGGPQPAPVVIGFVALSTASMWLTMLIAMPLTLRTAAVRADPPPWRLA